MTLNICMCERTSPKYGIGGIATVTHELSKQLVLLGNDVHVLCSAKSEFAIKQMPDQEDIDGVIYHYVKHSFKKPKPLYNISYNIGVIRELRMLHEKYHFDIFNIHYGLYGTLYPLVKHELKIPFVFTLPSIMREEALVNLGIAVKRLSMHETWFAFNLYLASYFEKQIVHNADLIISNSNYTSILLKKVYGDVRRCRTIYPGVSERFFPMNLKKEGVRLLYSGRLDQRKGIHVLLKAFKIIMQDYNDIELFIGGDGPDRKRLEAYVKDNNMTESVKFLGRAPYEKVPEIFNKSSIFVFPTLYEPFGLVAAEALATELPVIASRVGALPEIVDESCGILVPPNNPEALADAIELLISDGSLRRTMGKNGREKVKEKFSWERMAKEVVDAYESIL